jgi:hypothetical protein
LGLESLAAAGLGDFLVALLTVNLRRANHRFQFALSMPGWKIACLKAQY